MTMSWWLCRAEENSTLVLRRKLTERQPNQRKSVTHIMEPGAFERTLEEVEENARLSRLDDMVRDARATLLHEHGSSRFPSSTSNIATWGSVPEPEPDSKRPSQLIVEDSHLSAERSRGSVESTSSLASTKSGVCLHDLGEDIMSELATRTNSVAVRGQHSPGGVAPRQGPWSRSSRERIEPPKLARPSQKPILTAAQTIVHR